MQSTDPLNVAERWLADGRSVALGTVIATWGSAPRQAGSQIAVRDDGAFTGSVSGGCVEGAVIEAALISLREGKFRRLAFGVTDEKAWSVGLACGGRIEIFVEPLRDAGSLSALNQIRRSAGSVVRAVALDGGEARLIDPYTDISPLGLAAAAAARSGAGCRTEIAGRQYFLAVFHPPVDLVVVGAVHIAQALAGMAAQLGFRLRLIDPRASFATAERFPGLPLDHAWPDEALARAPLGPRSALIALSHDPKIDDPALVAALASPAFYIGALGSKKTQAARLARLQAAGIAQEALARIHGPVGLAIGAKSPEEIALSILAGIVESLHQPGR
jgi:xanthine dehydrogenase accessory factor